MHGHIEQLLTATDLLGCQCNRGKVEYLTERRPGLAALSHEACALHPNTRQIDCCLLATLVHRRQPLRIDAG